jgi:hypothetical protein
VIVEVLVAFLTMKVLVMVISVPEAVPVVYAMPSKRVNAIVEILVASVMMMVLNQSPALALERVESAMPTKEVNALAVTLADSVMTIMETMETTEISLTQDHLKRVHAMHSNVVNVIVEILASSVMRMVEMTSLLAELVEEVVVCATPTKEVNAHMVIHADFHMIMVLLLHQVDVARVSAMLFKRGNVTVDLHANFPMKVDKVMVFN